MRIGAVIIGDELLSGKRRDAHLEFLIDALRRRHLELSFLRLLGDEPESLTENLRQTLASGSLVFCFGGIGATPDDRTRQCLALAAGLDLLPHPEAVAIIERRFGADAYPQRVKMAHLPQGARLIPNPVNEIPGFSLGHHHCVPGFPSMAWPMVEWVLDTHYAHLFGSEPLVERRFLVTGTPESELIPTMEAVIEAFPNVRLSSLPSGTPGCREVELGVRGVVADADAAAALMMDLLKKTGVRFGTLD